MNMNIRASLVIRKYGKNKEDRDLRKLSNRHFQIYLMPPISAFYVRGFWLGNHVNVISPTDKLKQE